MDKIRFYYALFVVFFGPLFLSACVDLSGSRTISIASQKQKQHYKSAKGEVYTMRGVLGSFSNGMNQLEQSVKQEYKIPASSTIWYKSNQEAHSIVSRYKARQIEGPIILIGHSLGANEQIIVSQQLNKAHIPVDLLVTVESVLPFQIPPNVKQVLNFYTPSFIPMFSGLPVGAMRPEQTKVTNINVRKLGVHVNHFTIDKNKKVQSLILSNIKQVLNETNRSKSQAG